MTISSFAISMFIVSVSFVGYAQCEDPPLTPFGKKVRKDISNENFYKIFSVNYTTNEELEKAVMEASIAFYKVLGLPRDESVAQKIDDRNEKLRGMKVTPEIKFHSYTYAISKTFTQLGILTDDNIDDLAQKFADEINKAAENLKTDDVVSTYVALATATATFYKSQGVTSEPDINLIDKYYLEEIAKYDEKPSFLGNLIGGLLGGLLGG